MPSNKENRHSHATSEHEHEHSLCHKGHSSVPSGCASDELYRLENCNGGTGVRHVSARARSGVRRRRTVCSQGPGQRCFQGNCFKCERTQSRSMLAQRTRKWKQGRLGDRKRWIQRKEMPKGDWSNSRHTWDSSWHHSNCHGKTCGLEVDPWTAVEPVPYLCAVILNPCCEDFSKPKRMSRGTPTKTSQSGSPNNFAHLNEFSILAPDDNEFNGECCASKHTSRIRCQQRRYGDERADECITALETKFSSHRGSGTSQLSAYQVSYIAASGGDSKGVHHVSGSGWRALSAECVARENIAKSIPLVETEA